MPLSILPLSGSHISNTVEEPITVNAVLYIDQNDFITRWVCASFFPYCN